MNIAQLRKIVKQHIEGQGTAVDTASVLPIILLGVLDALSTNDFSADFSDDFALKSGIRISRGVLATLTLKSSADTITTASDLTKAEAAEALGVTIDDLDALLDGSFLRFKYGSSLLGVDELDETGVSLGAGLITVAVSDDTYSITVAE
jgi:hypothetical protein